MSSLLVKMAVVDLDIPWCQLAVAANFFAEKFPACVQLMHRPPGHNMMTVNRAESIMGCILIVQFLDLI